MMQRITPILGGILQRMGPEGSEQSESYLRNELCEYERVMAQSSTPFCLLRRSGEILRCNRTFCKVVGIGVERMAGLRIFELLTEEACVNWWEVVLPAYLEPATVLTSVVFRSGGFENGMGEEVECLASVTVKVDDFKMPILVIATFIPTCVNSN